MHHAARLTSNKRESSIISRSTLLNTSYNGRPASTKLLKQISQFRKQMNGNPSLKSSLKGSINTITPHRNQSQCASEQTEQTSLSPKSVKSPIFRSPVQKRTLNQQPSNGTILIEPYVSPRHTTMFKTYDSGIDLGEKSPMSSAEDIGEHRKVKSLKQVDVVAWIILLTISIECFIEGMAFALTAKDNIGSGIAILIAMVVRVVPMKLGYAQILSKSGLSYLQEHLFTTLATSVILIGAFIGLLADLEPYKRYCFAGLAGIFLYTSLCSIFPVINDTLNECRQATQEMNDLSEEDAQSLKNKELELLRIFIVNTGFFTALAIMAPLIWFEKEIVRMVSRYTDQLCT